MGNSNIESNSGKYEQVGWNTPKGTQSLQIIIKGKDMENKEIKQNEVDGLCFDSFKELQ